MRKLALLSAVAFFLGLGVSVAYGYSKDQGTNVAPQKGKEEVKKLADTKGTSIKEETEKYQKQVQKELNEYKKKMKQLQAKGHNMSDKAKTEVKKEIGELKKKMDVVEQRLKSMKSASAEAWEKIKSEIDTAMESIRNGYQEMADRFK